MSKNIKELFSSWGSSKRQPPEHNEILKNKILSRPPLPDEALAKAGTRHLPWLSFAFAGLAVIMLFVNFVNYEPEVTLLSSRNYQTGGSSGSKIAQPQALNESAIAPDYYPYPGNDVDITDTREFLKTGYHAAIRTRDISDLSQQVRNIVKGVDGRVDSLNISEKSGYISFAVPASKFDAFQTQIKGLVRSKFIIETINTQNLLPQKQSIEEAQETISTKLSVVRSQRSSLTATHNRTIANLNTQLASAQTEEERATIRTRIANENSSYSRKLSSLNAQISEYQAALDNTNKQDTKLINNVATVQGTISLQWISVWEVINLYAGPYWLPIILAIAACAAYFNYRRSLALPPMYSDTSR
ncbi:MAG: hypothetical protein AAB483_03210 [Patescibacteria group bacterium]